MADEAPCNAGLVGSEAQVLLDALASPVRREVLWLTWADELTVGELGAHVEVSGPTLSSHLSTLRDAGLVTMRVDGNFRRYRCNQDAVRALVPFLASTTSGGWWPTSCPRRSWPRRRASTRWS